eukprot:TRINITY_DN18334_c0_g1_i1.p3 TRINITY_DN18334_c0_g1~~TRINITY_DN18334_c0_g1_i1.p3  ORF type:complete len:101 (+),score=30.48 TRINITY_DN18334_c0_g1_i1:99-401(+)
MFVVIVFYYGFFFFFFKQKTAYEMLRSLVGSEMCIRDSCQGSFTSAGNRVGRYSAVVDHDYFSAAREIGWVLCDDDARLGGAATTADQRTSRHLWQGERG